MAGQQVWEHMSLQYRHLAAEEEIRLARLEVERQQMLMAETFKGTWAWYRVMNELNLANLRVVEAIKAARELAPPGEIELAASPLSSSPVELEPGELDSSPEPVAGTSSRPPNPILLGAFPSIQQKRGKKKRLPVAPSPAPSSSSSSSSAGELEFIETADGRLKGRKRRD